MISQYVKNLSPEDLLTAYKLSLLKKLVYKIIPMMEADNFFEVSKLHVFDDSFHLTVDLGLKITKVKEGDKRTIAHGMKMAVIRIPNKSAEEKTLKDVVIEYHEDQYAELNTSNKDLITIIPDDLMSLTGMTISDVAVLKTSCPELIEKIHVLKNKAIAEIDDNHLKMIEVPEPMKSALLEGVSVSEDWLNEYVYKDDCFSGLKKTTEEKNKVFELYSVLSNAIAKIEKQKDKFTCRIVEDNKNKIREFFWYSKSSNSRFSLKYLQEIPEERKNGEFPGALISIDSLFTKDIYDIVIEDPEKEYKLEIPSFQCEDINGLRPNYLIAIRSRVAVLLKHATDIDITYNAIIS